MTKVIQFHAEWCGPCSQQEPIIDQLEEENSDIDVERVDVDENQERANQYSVRGLPTIIVEDNDEVKASFQGLTQQNEIEEAL